MLRDQVKEDTKEIHKQVEQSAVMKDIMEGSIQPDVYVNYLYKMLAIYTMLESHPLYKNLSWDISLTSQCENDIEDLKAKYNIVEVVHNDEVVMYVNEIRKIDSIDALAAHAYVRYMADLSGGFVIKKKLPHDWPKNVYTANHSKRKVIIDFINNKISDHDLFKKEVAKSFESYSKLL